MFDYSEGWTWFVSGLTATVVVTVLLLIAVWAAGRASRRNRSLR